MWDLTGLAVIAGVVVLGGLAFYIWHLEQSRKELIDKLILLAGSRNSSEYVIAKAAQEGHLAPRPAGDNPMQDDEWEAMLATRRKAHDQATLLEFGEETEY